MNVNEEKFIIDAYIDEIEFSKDGIKINYQLDGTELIKWDDERIKHFTTK